MKRHKVQVTRPSASKRETQAILRDHPEILERIAAFEVGEMALISLEEVAIQRGVTLRPWKAGDKTDVYEVAQKRLSP